MILSRIIHCLLGIILISNCSLAQNKVNNSELLTSINSAIDKVISESNFDFTKNLQKPSKTLQSINFEKQFGQKYNAFGYAYSIINCSEDGEYLFGLSFSGKTDAWINNKKVYSSKIKTDFWFNEFAYDRYRFPITFKAICKKGNNPFLIRISSSDHWKFYLAALQNEGKIDERVDFTIDPEYKGTGKWLICELNDTLRLQTLFGKYDTPFDSIIDPSVIWSLPQVPIVAKVGPKSNSIFKKHSYTEWHYANGSMIWSILNYANDIQNKNYLDFVKRYCEFTEDNLEFFKYQYHELNEIHGFNHRIFRMHMLDDASAPALPFLGITRMGFRSKDNSLLNRVENYILNDQVRLPDGTFCRPEPWEQTIWADDLFMSAPYLMMLGEFTGNHVYFDEATSQVISFYKHLFNSEIGLCRHGWVNSPKKDSIPYWSRANGWMIWAISEVLEKLPKEHKDYKIVKELYRKHLKGLIAFQDKDGFLHQLINDPNSFTETSSTAMLTLAIARGVNQAWLPKEFRNNAFKSWQAVKSRIEPDGTVKGICEGTEISTDITYYLERKKPDHDPRGLGAVITAGLEIYKMNNNIK